MNQLLPPAPPARKPNPLLKWVRTYLVERTLWSLPRTDEVLDLCCGYGFYFGINPNARAVDGDPACVQHLRGKGFRVEQCDILQRLPYGDGAFRHVVAHDVLEHFTFEELRHVLAEVWRVLKPGGRFLVYVPNRKGYDYGLRIGAGHRLFVTRAEIDELRRGLFGLRRHFPEPLPRWLGAFFTHNKEVFELVKE